jgi:hypothetical protein
MNRVRKITAALVMTLLVFAMWSSFGQSLDQQVKRASSDKPPTSKEPTPSTAQTKQSGLKVEEKLVRDVYARAMRYQTAAVDELSAKTGKEARPEDYLTFELRNIHTGTIGEIYNRPLAEVVTPKSGDLISLKPNRISAGLNRLSKGNDLQHAYYSAEWTVAISEQLKTRQASTITVSQMLAQLGNRAADITEYTSYDVTVRLNGKQRTYQALILYHLNSVGKANYRTEAERSERLAGIEILDNITSEMNTVLTEKSPRIRSPWDKYSKSNQYRAVIRSITESVNVGLPLIPVNAPIGYLPGDDVSPSTSDTMTAAATENCPDLRILRDSVDITDTTQNVVVGQQINLSLEAQPDFNEPSNIQWTIGGNRIANYVVNGTGPTGPSTGTVTPLTDLTPPDLTFYWINAGQAIEVSVEATVYGAQLTKHAYFNVVAPSNATPTVTLPTNGQLNINNLGDCSGSQPAPSMVFGNISGPNASCVYSGQAGIIFAPPTTTTPPGSFFFVQLINGDTVTYSRTGALLTCTATNVPGLDGRYP